MTPSGPASLPLPPSRRRVLRFRGGPWDGQTWDGDIDVGARIAHGGGPWTAASVYVVTEENVTSVGGGVESVAVPAPTAS